MTHIDDQILNLYAKELSTREIVDTFKELYDADLKTIYQASTEEVAQQALEQFAAQWDLQYLQISKALRADCQ